MNAGSVRLVPAVDVSALSRQLAALDAAGALADTRNAVARTHARATGGAAAGGGLGDRDVVDAVLSERHRARERVGSRRSTSDAALDAYALFCWAVLGAPRRRHAGAGAAPEPSVRAAPLFASLATMAGFPCIVVRGRRKRGGDEEEGGGGGPREAAAASAQQYAWAVVRACALQRHGLRDS